MTKPEFFLAGYEYRFTGRAETINPGWRFRCVTITNAPDSGERSALGWRKRDAEKDWEAYDYGQSDWDLRSDEMVGHALPSVAPKESVTAQVSIELLRDVDGGWFPTCAWSSDPRRVI